MRLGLRLALLLALVGVLPLSGLALAASGAARSWLVNSSVEFQVQTTEMLASVIGRQLMDTERVLKMQMANFQLAAASPQAQQAFLITTYRLFPDLSAVFLSDRAGVDVVPPVFQSSSADVKVAGHAVVTAGHIAAVRALLPTPNGEDVIWGVPTAQTPTSPAFLCGTIVSPWGDGTRLGVEISLAAVASRIRTLALNDREVVLFSLQGDRLIAEGPRGLVDVDSFKPLLDTVSADVRYQRADGGGEVLGAISRVPGRDLAVAMATPVASLDAAATQIRLRTGYIAGVTLLAAMVFGVMLSRSITDPVRALRDASSRMEAGDLGSQVALNRTDELGELATAFNRMARSLQQNQEDLGRKNAEIESFNVELQARVERRTAQLRATQASLVQSRQLAAVAELSAGLTHELNNPLAGVVGLLQVLRARSPNGDPLLDAAEREALRCKEIVGRLSRFTQAPPSAAGEREQVDVHLLIGDVLVLMAGALRERQLTVTHAVGSLLVQGEQAALGRALGQLIAAVRTLAPEGAAIDVHSADNDLVVRLAPVRASQDDWRAASLGFWAARQVFEEQGATVEEPVSGSSEAVWTVRFR
jgi:two-component system NtrC family sensor kinase